jgi:hypothetical protein
VAQAISDLAKRERAPLKLIGAVHVHGLQTGRMSTVCSTVSKWCKDNNWLGAVWTDLEPNFSSHTKQEFSVEAGKSYLRSLTGESLTEAHNYIENAPFQTRTPLRTALASDEWWQGLKKDRQA